MGLRRSLSSPTLNEQKSAPRGNFVSFFWDSSSLAFGSGEVPEELAEEEEELDRELRLDHERWRARNRELDEMTASSSSTSSTASLFDYSFSDEEYGDFVDDKQYQEIPSSKHSCRSSVACSTMTRDSGVMSASSRVSSLVTNSITGSKGTTSGRSRSSRRSLLRRNSSSLTCSADRRGGLYNIPTGRKLEPHARSQSSSTISEVSPEHKVRSNRSRSSAGIKPKCRQDGRQEPRQRKVVPSASFHHSESRQVELPDILKPTTNRPCCWECFEESVEKKRLLYGFPIKKAYLASSSVESPYENIPSSHHAEPERKTRRTKSGVRIVKGPPPPPPLRPRERRRDDLPDTADIYSKLCTIALAELRNAGGPFAGDRLKSLQAKVDKLLLLHSAIDLSSRNLADEAAFCKAANNFAYLIERRLRAIECYNREQYRRVCIELCSILAAARRKQHSTVDSIRRGLRKAVRFVF